MIDYGFAIIDLRENLSHIIDNAVRARDCLRECDGKGALDAMNDIQGRIMEARERLIEAADLPAIPEPEIPLPATLPLFATGIRGLGLLGWRRKRKEQAVA